MELEQCIFTLDLCIEYYILGKEMNWRSSPALLVFVWVSSIYPCPWPRKKIIFCSSNALLLVAMRTSFPPSPRIMVCCCPGFLSEDLCREGWLSWLLAMCPTQLWGAMPRADHPEELRRLQSLPLCTPPGWGFGQEAARSYFHKDVNSWTHPGILEKM